MRVVTKNLRAKNKKGTRVLILEEDRDVSISEPIEEEITAELIENKAKEIATFNQEQKDVFLEIIRPGGTGFIEQKYLQE